MKFPLNGKRVMIHGIKDDLASCKGIGAHKLKGLIKRFAITHCLELRVVACISEPIHSLSVLQDDQDQQSGMPPQIQVVVRQFSHLFQEPTSVPPSRDVDHHIPLVPGAQPVNIRPYKYSPQQKSEIEKQVEDMLKRRVIQHSVSSFASPVLLVKKKDGTWRFCVDYRHLNAITVKNKHPLPIVDELLDELAGVQWFTKLDFRSGYHQIRVAKGDEMKTTFKTHSGLYEFRVMSFGLTNAPASFQSTMNKIFQPLLRNSVLVFMDDILVYSATLEDHVKHLEQVFSIL
jgi:hypothetical protein